VLGDEEAVGRHDRLALGKRLSETKEHLAAVFACSVRGWRLSRDCGHSWARVALPYSSRPSIGRCGRRTNTSGSAPSIPLDSDCGPVVIDPGWCFRVSTVMTLVGGTMFLMWLGEQITARGIGNGPSLIIVSGVVAALLERAVA